MSKNKKGFTLIELLAVVTLIVLVSIIVIPNIVSSIRDKKGEISSANMQLLASAADVYINNHSGMYASSFEADGSTYCIPLQTLINDGILETPFKDLSGNEVDYTDVVKATYVSSKNGFNYEFVKKNQCSEFVQYISRPVLAEGMIPVVYEDGVWKKADSTSKWYNYSEKKWANAVLVREWKGTESGSKSRYEYLEASYGTEVKESDILAYFVWIPRFRYQLFDSNTPVSINIVFEGIGTTKSLGTTAGQWLTHPAFTYNNQELSGIWVGKYETSNSDNNPIIKSGKTPWKNISYEDAINISSTMSNQNNIYGLKEVNSHLTFNSEWSAVAYLSNSAYGINSKIDASSSSLTGQSASTTNNETGVYDMSGVSPEYVIMDYGTLDLGQAFSETDGWYGDVNTNISSASPYLVRGQTSIYNYSSVSYNDMNTSSRVTIVNSSSSPILRENLYIVSSGDGLYRSNINLKRLIYRGADPDNYIVLNEGTSSSPSNVTYRIVSYEPDGTLKVVRDESIGSKIFDERNLSDTTTGPRHNSNNTFCNYSGIYYGCNVWGNMNNTYYNGSALSPEFKYRYYLDGSSTVLQDGTYAGTVTTNSSLNTYLNDTWITGKAMSAYISDHDFSVGGIYYDASTTSNKSLRIEKAEEELYTWNGKIGLMNITEYVETSTNPACTSVYSNYYYNIDYFYEGYQHLDQYGDWPCGNGQYNWLPKTSITEWVLSPYSYDKTTVWLVDMGGFFAFYVAYDNNDVRPAFYLKSSVRLGGMGTADNPYYIIGA